MVKLIAGRLLGVLRHRCENCVRGLSVLTFEALELLASISALHMAVLWSITAEGVLYPSTRHYGAYKSRLRLGEGPLRRKNSQGHALRVASFWP
jgi:hypothetical protein